MLTTGYVPTGLNPQVIIVGVSWEIILVPEVHDWFMALDDISASLVRGSVEFLRRARPRARPPRGGPDHRLQVAQP